MEKSDIITRKWEKYFLKQFNTWHAPANGDGQPKCTLSLPPTRSGLGAARSCWLNYFKKLIFSNKRHYYNKILSV